MRARFDRWRSRGVALAELGEARVRDGVCVAVEGDDEQLAVARVFQGRGERRDRRGHHLAGWQRTNAQIGTDAPHLC